MGRLSDLLVAFNRGLISPLALARVDLDRVALSAETMDNWIPRTLGSMTFRPGGAYLGNSASNNKARHIPFVYNISDKAIVELTAAAMRIWISDALVERPSVATTIANGGFDVDLNNWADNDGASATSAWVTGGYLGLTGNTDTFAAREATINIGAADVGVEHGVTISITRGPVWVQIGSTSGGDEYFSKVKLDPGTHSIAFTPTDTPVYLELSSRELSQSLVDSVSIDSGGVLEIAAPWAETDLPNLRWDISGDIIYVASGSQNYKIERRSTRGWGIAKYLPDHPPFRAINTTPITITPSALSGNITLTASEGIFKTTNVGGMFKIASDGQTVTGTFSAENQFTDPIKVTGTANSRIFSRTVSGRTDSTITVQRSLTGPTSNFKDVLEITANNTKTFDDELDNQDAWYRIGIKTGDYGTDTVTVTLDYTNGSIVGTARVTGFTSRTVVTAEVVVSLGGTDAQKNWYESSWSDRRGWPTEVQFIDGRLCWMGVGQADASVSDDFERFEEEFEGDSGPIQRTYGSGASSRTNWAVAVKRLLSGTDLKEWNLRASSEDEILTPSNSVLRSISTKGSAYVMAEQLDGGALYVQKGGQRLIELASSNGIDFVPNDLTVLYPEAGVGQIIRLAVQRDPDTRIFCLKADGSMSIMIYDPVEEISAWVTLSPSTNTSPVIEDVFVMPGDEGSTEDAVYLSVQRTINGATVRFLERLALENECIGGTLNKQVDAHVTGTVSMGTMTGLSHLEGEEVCVWVNGADVGTYTVSGGVITGVTADGSAVAGLAYRARFKSSKLRYLLKKKNLKQLGVILSNTHHQGLTYGFDFDSLDDLPAYEDGAEVAADTIHSSYDEETFEFDGDWDTDSRLCLEANSPRPCTVLAALMEIEG